jgi:hypothetical protein
VNDKMRKEFEAWYSSKAKNNYMHLDKVDDEYIIRAGIDPARRGEYVHTPAQEQWAAWEASREELVIDLSDPSNCFSPDGLGDWAMWLDDVKKLIEAAGVKVKS